MYFAGICFDVISSKNAVIPRLLRYKTTLPDPQVSLTCSDWVGSFILVRDGRLELPTSCSQSKRATNCANPGFLVIQFCTRCGQTCGQAVFLTTLACGGNACIAGVSMDCEDSVFRLEGGATRSQTRRDTNFAIPGYSLFRHDTTANGKNKVFSVCGQTCGQSRLCTAFSNRRKSRKCRCRKALRRFTLPYPGYRHGTPKPGAIPASLYPDMRVSADKHSAIIAKAAGECKHFLILKKN